MPVSDEGVRHLAALKQLRMLNLQLTNTMDTVVDELRKALPGCRIVH